MKNIIWQLQARPTLKDRMAKKNNISFGNKKVFLLNLCNFVAKLLCCWFGNIAMKWFESCCSEK